MTVLEQPGQQVDAQARLREMQDKLRRLERRDWFLWMTNIVVMLLLLAAVIVLSFPNLLAERDELLRMELDTAVRGLVGVVLLFNSYSIWQQSTIKRLRRQMADQLESTIRLHARAEELHRLAVLDPLTGLYNRRYAEERLKAETGRSRRHGYDLSVVVFDLNKFKQINDTFGHAAGDQVLRVFGERLQHIIRISDVAARMGGDEFLLLLPECSPAQVPILLARIGDPQIEWDGQTIPIEWSAGWTGYQSGEGHEPMLERADQMLYENKRASKAGRATPARN